MPSNPVWFLFLILIPLVVTMVWTVDLFWMIWMRREVCIAFALTFLATARLAFMWADAVELSVVGGYVLTVFILRIGVDLVYWLYDISRLRITVRTPLAWIAGASRRKRPRIRWPVVFELHETVEQNRDRLAEGPEPIWGYFRERMRLRQEIEYRARFVTNQ